MYNKVQGPQASFHQVGSLTEIKSGWAVPRAGKIGVVSWDSPR